MANVGPLLVFFSVVACIVANPRRKRLISANRNHVLWMEDVPDYPKADAERLLAELKSQNKTKYFLTSQQIDEINKHKKHENISYNDLCAATKKRFFPQLVKIDDEEFFVLNPKSRLIQYIDVQVCLSPGTSSIGNEGQACRLVEDASPGYTSKCVQEYITRKIYLISNDIPRKLITKSIDIKSCCSCFTEYDDIS